MLVEAGCSFNRRDRLAGTIREQEHLGEVEERSRILVLEALAEVLAMGAQVARFVTTNELVRVRGRDDDDGDDD